jgi:predicted negative regulator of RcsB-dependent stress response
MKAMAVAVAALFLLSGAAVRAEDECDEVMDQQDDTMLIAANLYQQTIEEITKKKPETDAEKTAFRNKFCALTGEMLGMARANRALVQVCRTGDKRRRALADLNEAVKKFEDATKEACE